MLVAFLVAPEDWYRAFWILWSAGFLAAVVIVARVFLVRPMIRAHREDTGRIVEAIRLQGNHPEGKQ